MNLKMARGLVLWGASLILGMTLLFGETIERPVGHYEIEHKPVSEATFKQFAGRLTEVAGTRFDSTNGNVRQWGYGANDREGSIWLVEQVIRPGDTLNLILRGKTPSHFEQLKTKWTIRYYSSPFLAGVSAFVTNPWPNLLSLVFMLIIAAEILMLALVIPFWAHFDIWKDSQMTRAQRFGWRLLCLMFWAPGSLIYGTMRSHSRRMRIASLATLAGIAVVAVMFKYWKEWT